MFWPTVLWLLFTLLVVISIGSRKESNQVGLGIVAFLIAILACTLLQKATCATCAR